MDATLTDGAKNLLSDNWRAHLSRSRGCAFVGYVR